ncbi:threonine/homoserine/homoserine lactone efflux protein [Stackebrandtia albiflava]|uniref:Threonine/homoserine/homoserine lactone efflux protein n=1 Tax=Stackebrandtia albiflava TaxID=406432 RepID=A0A562VER8_9ACTN|nr:LysE family translocator [Stackebrandtia albiflava]TWJ16372.1 threonine/homoserine/homoserine lactone efflux protein [Stackebrandtia albiflava]
MVEWTAVTGMAAVALGMALMPGPNMFYLVSRALSQGRRAGVVSLCGVAAGFLTYLVAAVAGLTAVFTTVPVAYTVLKFGGAVYLLYLAWQAFRPGAGSPFTPRPLKPVSGLRLFSMGYVTNLLNPKIAMLYVSLLPQFVEPERGAVAAQSLWLGLVQVTVAVAVNGVIMLSAASLSRFLTGRPGWMRAQRAVMGGVLAGFAVKLAVEPHRV